MRMTKDLISMAGRRVVVTGAASGIGRAIALRLADAGADLILLDANAAGVAQTADEVSAIAGSVLTHVVDVSDKAQIDAFWKRFGSGPGLPDTLINNTSAYPMHDYLEVDEEFLERALRMNVESVLWMCQAFIAARKRRGGVIVNVSSVEAFLPFRDDLISNSMGKAGILALTRALAQTYGKHGFRVNVLVPGAIHTLDGQRAPRRLDVDMPDYHFDARVALGRWGEADEVARAALFLASDLASYVQGSILPVDGGFVSV